MVPRGRAIARAGVAGLVLGAAWVLARDRFADVTVLLARRGLHVDAAHGGVHWIDPPGLAPRRALVLATRDGEADPDVYAVTARTGAGDRAIALDDVSDLTRSRDASEEALVVNERFGAFASRVDDRVVAVTVVDLAGDPGEPGATFGQRFRSSITRWQQTGRRRGYGIVRYDLVHPVAGVRLALLDATLEVSAPGLAFTVDCGAQRVTAGATSVNEHPRHGALTGTWVTWAVDTVRAVPWIGPDPIAWAETVAFSAEHAVARARADEDTTHTAREAAEDLADVLDGNHPAGTLEGPVAGDWPPAQLVGPLGGNVAHEGEWVAVGQGDDPFVRTMPGAPPPMYVTFVRTDAERSDARVYITVWDPRAIELHVVPGSEEPMGATGETGTGAIPRDPSTMRHLVAGFNGAFQALHGEFGVYGEGMVLLPAKPYAATIALLADGDTGFGTWPAQAGNIPDSIVEFRQNLTPLIDEGAFNPWRRSFWGGIIGNPADLHTTRSGVCLTREGFVAYLWGQTLTPRTLADAMLAARCRYGVHLDMNGANTGFELYRAGAHRELPALNRRLDPGYEAEGEVGGMADMFFRARKLVRRMSQTLPRYIRRDPRDFFYLALRPLLPGPALVPPSSAPQAGEGVWHVAGLGAAAFPWPMARTRIRPDATMPDRWVNLVRIDARRVAFAPADAHDGVLGRWVGAQAPRGDTLRIAMTDGAQGRHWSIATAGDGIGGEVLAPGSTATRGAGIDADGFLVLAVADRAMPDLVDRALTLAGCSPQRIALGRTALALADGRTGAAGETLAADTTPTLALVEYAMPRGVRLFPEVVPVSPARWQEVQHRQVRYTRNPDAAGTMQVHLAGQAPVVVPIRGYVADGGVPSRGSDAGH